MTLLELITNVSTNSDAAADHSKYPFTFNMEPIIPKLQPDTENPNPFSLVEPVKGFDIEGPELAVAKLNATFFKKLQRRLNNNKSLEMGEFTLLLFQFLHQIGPHVGSSVVGNSADEVCVAQLVTKLGHYITNDVLGLIIEASCRINYLELLSSLIINGVIADSSKSSGFISSLIEKRSHGLLILCIKHFSDLSSSDLLDILRLYLNPIRQGGSNLTAVRTFWEGEALSAVKAVKEAQTDVQMLKNAAILLMVAYDEFSTPELCLHYLLSSLKVDESVLSSTIAKLSVVEIEGLVSYLGKLLRKYERYPEAVPCPEASTQCRWVPSVKDAIVWLGLVLNEHFSTLVLHPEFHQELRSVMEVVDSLAAEAKMSSSLASLCAVLKPEEKK